ncbi:MAG: hypothetical protein ABIJ47_00330 [Candidatus Bathyarchaeota archaeon]
MSTDHIWDRIKDKSNVVGYSKRLRRRIRDGVEMEEEVIRVYVSRKLHASALDLKDLIPGEIDGVPTDVVEIGDMRALNIYPMAHVTRVRPLVAGVSIGNWAITAGTLGWFFRDGRGRDMLGSNAHVFAEDPLSQSSGETRIVQPGRADGGIVPEDMVGTYNWHQPLAGSGCAFSNAIVGLLNGASALLGRRTRFHLKLTDRARIDFAVAEPTVDYELKLLTAEEWDDFVGLGFAGSSQASFFCKAEHIEAAGWKPVEKTIQAVTIGDTIHKIGRTSEYTSGQILDDSAYGRVSYGGLSLVEFDDVILTTPMLEAGDSGDSAWKTMIRNAE